MNTIDIANEIMKKIKQIDDIRAEIKQRGANKAKSESDYDKAVALTIIRLRNGVSMQLEGQTIQNPPVSNIDKIAKGICWQEKLAMEEAVALYKSAVTNLDAIQSQLNAYQSVNRHLDKV